MFPAPADAIRVDSRSCSKTERAQILNAVRWLKSQRAAIKARLGTDGLAQFEGRSEQRWKELLNSRKTLIKCDRGRKCNDSTHQVRFGDKRLPLRHTTPITLCTSHLDEAGHYAVVLAHEFGHLVWINAHQKACVKRCNQPRLSQSLTRVAYHLWTGTAYDRMACLNECTPGFVPSEPAENLEMPLAPRTPNDETLTPTAPDPSIPQPQLAP